MIYTPLTKEALKISFWAHKDQMDKSGIPYVFHPFHLAEQMDDEYSVCVALLHDVVEDTSVSLKDLAFAGFPPEVIDAIALMTHQDGVPYMDYVRKIKTNPLARKVKLADLSHNSDVSRLDHIDDRALERVKKYEKAKRILTSPDTQDMIRGALFGGAVGDALGYAVEFMGEEEIFEKYGEGGIREYSTDESHGKAVISDDTQMSLFTANALIFGMRRQKAKGISGEPRAYINMAYQDWLCTQEYSCEQVKAMIADHKYFWISDMLLDVPELYCRRAPGTTCLSGLRIRREQKANREYVSNFVEDRINDSKGCGGVMRVAPIGAAIKFYDIERLDKEGAEAAAVTHGNSLGYMPAAVLTHIINRIVYPVAEMTLKEIIQEACDTVAKIYKDDDNIDRLRDIIELAVRLSENNDADIHNIHRLGEGWVAEEALAIAIYCSLKYKSDFSKAIIASVNHKGDSDSTGSITGNILGAYLGYEAIQEKWKKNLQLSDVILSVADALYEEFR